MEEKSLKILFVISGKKSGGSPITRNQGASLEKQGVLVDYYIVNTRGVLGYLCNIKPLRKQIKSKSYDVIHAHYAFCGYLASLATIGMSIPIVTSVMGSDIQAHKIYPCIARLFAKCTPWQAVVVKSQEMKRRLGVSRAIVLPNGVNMDRFKEYDKQDCQKRLGWDVKKVHVLLPADPSDPRKNAPLAEGAIKLLNESGNYNIEFHGMVGVPNEHTPILYNAADAVVLPSLYEGSANAVKEAMACNVPIVTTDMGDCRERLDGLDGCYVAKTYEVEKFAELLEKAIKFDGRTKGRERLLADELSDSQVAQKLVEIYKRVMKK